MASFQRTSLPRSISEGMSEDMDGEGSPKTTRSVSVCDEHQMPSSHAHRGGEGDGRYPPVLVLSHPTMRKMATRLVQATTARMLKLKLNSTVSYCVTLIVYC